MCQSFQNPISDTSPQKSDTSPFSSSPAPHPSLGTGSSHFRFTCMSSRKCGLRRRGRRLCQVHVSGKSLTHQKTRKIPHKTACVRVCVSSLTHVSGARQIPKCHVSGVRLLKTGSLTHPPGSLTHPTRGLGPGLWGFVEVLLAKDLLDAATKALPEAVNEWQSLHA